MYFPKGAVVSVNRVVDDNWFEGAFKDSFGLIPRSYVEILVVGGGGGGGPGPGVGGPKEEGEEGSRSAMEEGGVHHL